MTTQAAVSGHHVEHDEPNYIAIFIYLAVLTGVELVGQNRAVFVSICCSNLTHRYHPLPGKWL